MLNQIPCVHSFAYRCAAAARAKGYKYFGLQFGGECWARPDEENRYNMYGAGSQCFDHLSNPLQPCNDKTQEECMGLQSENYVHRIKQGETNTEACVQPFLSHCSAACCLGLAVAISIC